FRKAQANGFNGIPSVRIRRAFRIHPAVAARLTPLQIRQLLKDPTIKQIELDSKVKASMYTARRSFGVEAAQLQFGFTGNADGIKGNYSVNDIVVAVIDTGVDTEHPDLQRKVKFFKDYLAQRTSPYDDNGHGTHVAGVIAGSGKLNPKYAGVAPEAALVVFKVLDSAGSGFVSDVIAATEEIIDRKAEFHIRILNLSLEVPEGSSAGDDSFSIACNNAVANGIVVVIAAGNSGPDRRTIGEGAAAARAITVGAGADTGENGFYLWPLSSRGPTADGRIKPDLFAPGVDIRSVKRTTGYSGISGTSFAAPFVAGVAALMFEANPALTTGNIRNILIGNSRKWGPGKKNNEAGGGRLQAYQAISRAAAITEDLVTPVVPRLKFFSASLAQGARQTYTVEVASKRFPLAITAIADAYPDARLELKLISPTGLVRTSSNFGRQVQIVFDPSEIGVYQLQVKAFQGATSYLLDISADLSS
ncbi:MAG TPA: S8 family peptidase, partial [Acidobacteriota bacterium]